MAKIIGLISGVSILIPCIIATIRFNQNNQEIRPIIYYIIVGVVFELINYQISDKGQTTYITSNLFNIIEMCILGIILLSWMHYGKIKLMNVFLFIVILITWIIYFINVGMNSIPVKLNIIKSICLIIFGVSFIYQQSREIESLSTNKLLFAFAVIFYFLSNSIIISFSNYLLSFENKQYWIYYSIIDAVSNIIFNTLIGVVLLRWKTKSLSVL